MINTSQKQKKNMPSSMKFGYSRIYEEIVSERAPSKKFEGIVYNLLLLPVMILVAATGVATVDQGLDFAKAISWLIIIFLVFSFLAIGIGWIFGFFAFAFPGPPPTRWLVARLIIEVHSPFGDRFGLNYQEINHLKEIAQIDQASADWKSGFLTIGILSLLLAVIQGLSKDIGQFISDVVLIGPPETGIVSEYYVSVILWGLAITIVVLITLSIFRPLGEFLANEPLNHVILDACEEAKGLLEVYRFTHRKSLKLKEKLKIADECECIIVEDIKPNRNWFFKAYQFTDEYGKAWLLRPVRFKVGVFTQLRGMIESGKGWFWGFKNKKLRSKHGSVKRK